MLRGWLEHIHAGNFGFTAWLWPGPMAMSLFSSLASAEKEKKMTALPPCKVAGARGAL